MMLFQSLRVSFCLLAVVAVVASGCSNDKKTQQQTKAKRDESSSIAKAPRIVRMASLPTDMPTDMPEEISPPAALPGDDPPQGNDAVYPEMEGDSTQFAELISEPYEPDVELSEIHASTCRIGMHDTFPSLELNDLKGGRQPLSRFYGKRLTVVVFWHSGDRYALEELADLEPLVGARFGKQGVGIVAVNVKGSVGRNQDLIETLSIKYPMLLDAKGQAWGKLTNESAGPSVRTFLLDAEGKILWFDIEYSRSTRRDLILAIRHQLQ